VMTAAVQVTEEIAAKLIKARAERTPPGTTCVSVIKRRGSGITRRRGGAFARPASTRSIRPSPASSGRPPTRGADPFLMLTAGRARPVGATFGEWLSKVQWTPSNRARERRDHERTFEQLPAFTALPVKAIDQAAKNDALEKRGKSARRKATSWIEAVMRYAETGVIISAARATMRSSTTRPCLGATCPASTHGFSARCD
jgi:hypothetical protein